MVLNVQCFFGMLKVTPLEVKQDSFVAVVFVLNHTAESRCASIRKMNMSHGKFKQ